MKKYFFLFLFVLLLTTICFKSSLLYPFNDWDDSNMYLSMGRIIAGGGTPYVDIYDHKGPLTFFLYGFIYLLPGDHFTGLYIVELISAFCFLYISYKTTLLSKNSTSIIPILLLGMVYTSKVFRAGGSMEELFLPLLMYIVYIYIKAVDTHCLPTIPESVFAGIIIGVLLLTKFTLLATILGVYICYTFYCIRNRQLKHYFTFALSNMAGCLTVFLPLFIYLLQKGLITDMFEAYITTNLTDYNPEITWLHGFTYGLLTTPFFLLAVIVCIFILMKKRKKPDILVISVLLFIVTFMKKPYGYYEIPLCILISLALPYIPLPSKPQKCPAFLPAIGLLILSYFLSPNTYLIHYSKEELPQYRFHETIQEDSLLCITSLDLGFYTTGNKPIPCKYLGIYNANVEPVARQLSSLAHSEEYEYIITDTGCQQLVTKVENYELVEQIEFPRDAIRNYTETYYLYRLNHK